MLNYLNKLFSKKEIPKDNSYLIKLFNNIEFVFTNKKKISFKIVKRTKKGFLIKVGGLFGYVHSDKMPWQYKSHKKWDLIESKIIDKVFYSKIIEFVKKPVKIVLDSRVHEFEKLDITDTIQIVGTIIDKVKYGIFVEFGWFFDWKYGSLVGLIHKSNVKDFTSLNQLKKGSDISCFFYGKINDKIVLADEYFQIEWINGSLDKFIGTTQKVTINFNENLEKEYYVEGEFLAILPIIKTYYSNSEKKRLKKILNKINTDTIAECEVVGINYKKRHLILKWINNLAPTTRPFIYSSLGKEYVLSQRTKQYIASELKDKYIDVTIKKITDSLGRKKTKYYLDTEITANVIFTNRNYTISKKEQKLIELLIKGNSIINCKVLGLDGKIYVEYNLSNKDLYHFFSEIEKLK